MTERKKGKHRFQGRIVGMLAAVLFLGLEMLLNAQTVWAQEEMILPPSPQNEVQGTEALSPGWIKQDSSWYWVDPDQTFHKGWLFQEGRYYFMDEKGVMVTGWYPVEDSWYYFHEDGGMNLGELELGNGTYAFSSDGQLTFAQRTHGTGGGAYEAGCYDLEEQQLFDRLNEKKKDQYFEEHPEREGWESGEMGYSYDRYASFRMDMALNRAAAHRLKRAMEQGYADGKIPGDGTVNDYLASVPYRKNSSCLELYIRNCQDGEEAFDKLEEQMNRAFESKKDRKYSLTYYRNLGMSHKEENGSHSFMVIFMR